MRCVLALLVAACGCGAVHHSGEAGPRATLTRDEAVAAQKKAPADLKTVIAFAKTYYAANNDWPSDAALGTDSSTAHLAPYRLAVSRSTFPHWHTIEVRGVESTGYADVPAWIEPRHAGEPWFAAALIANLDGDSELDIFTADLTPALQHDVDDMKDSNLP